MVSEVARSFLFTTTMIGIVGEPFVWDGGTILPINCMKNETMDKLTTQTPKQNARSEAKSDFNGFKQHNQR